MGVPTAATKATEVAAGLLRAAKVMQGIVVSAGLMDKTVKVRLEGQRWEKRVQKWYREPRYMLVHDPRNSLRQGDVVAITPSWRESQHVRHAVKHIIAPCGPGIEDRPPIPTIEERAAERLAKHAVKAERRAFRNEVDKAVTAAERISISARKATKIFRRFYYGGPEDIDSVDGAAAAAAAS